MMEEIKLPTEIAQEPEEEAKRSQNTAPNNNCVETSMKKQIGVTFAEATQSSEHASQTSTSTYKDALSQPAPGLSHTQRLLWLQKRRKPGLWAQCDDCDKWRFLPQAIDAHELPAKWSCRMNPDKTIADCSVPEKPLSLREEEDMIFGDYSCGSVVWARLAGYPWWPAMVDDCPDTEQFYWLDGFCDIPTHYNVVFFDAEDATRAWIAPENLKPYGPYKNSFQKLPNQKYGNRIEKAVTQADDANQLPLAQRLAKYSFITRYPGAIKDPRNISKRVIKKFQDKLKRKYNVEFSDESSNEDEGHQNHDQNDKNKTTVIKTGTNVLLIGTRKSKKARISKTENVKSKTKQAVANRLEDSLLENAGDDENGEKIPTDSAAVNVNTDSANDTFKQPNSMAVQIGSTVISTVADASLGLDNDTSATYVPGSESDSESLRETVQNVRARAVSPSSDDFEF